MSILTQLSSALGRRDELPNQQVAERIVATQDKGAIGELVQGLVSKNKRLRHDCIKALYEVGMPMPNLIAPYLKTFIGLLNSKDNRMVWGAMTSLHAITQQVPDEIYAALPQIIAAADAGTVITNDHCVGILCDLCQQKEYREHGVPLLLERILKSPENQLPTYAENALALIGIEERERFITIIQTRIPEVESLTKKARLLKVLAKAQKLLKETN